MKQQPEAQEVTQLLQLWKDGEQQALGEIFDQAYDQIRDLAKIQFRKHKQEDMLQTTALVHEAFLRMANGKKVAMGDRNHFYALISMMMCRILVEKARSRLAAKRGGDLLVALEEECEGVHLPHKLEPETLLSMDNGIRQLEKTNQRAARVVELKIFGEFEDQEIADILGISKATVKRDWVDAKKELFLLLSRK